MVSLVLDGKIQGICEIENKIQVGNEYELTIDNVIKNIF